MTLFFVKLDDSKKACHARFTENGHTLYVAQLGSDTLSRLDVAASGGSAVVEDQVVDADLQRPTAVLRDGDTLYVLRSQFGTAAPDAVFTVAAVTGF